MFNTELLGIKIIFKSNQGSDKRLQSKEMTRMNMDFCFSGCQKSSLLAIEWNDIVKTIPPHLIQKQLTAFLYQQVALFVGSPFLV
jgi:hypothetical protein